MAAKEIYDYDYLYRIEQIIVGFAYRNFFRKIVIKGEENLPKDKPFILAPNHQNALMDALAFVCTIKEQPVFMARADIFGKKKIIDNILHSFNIMPVYRIRDGYSSLGKNDQYFEKASEVLEHQVPLCLFAEGRHNNKRQQLPLVKGMFRIAFRAQEKLEKKNLQIVPAGLDYENYFQFGSNLIINFGKPIDLQPFYETYLKNEAVGINNIRDTVAEKMSEQMLNIRSKEHYDSFYDLCNILTPFVRRKNKMKNDIWNNFLCRKEIAEKLDIIENVSPVKNQEIQTFYNQYQYLLVKNKIDCSALELNPSALVLIGKLLLSILFFPLFPAGCILNFIPFTIPCLISKKIKDTQFKSSVKLITGLVLFFLYYFFLTIIAAFVLPNGWLALAVPFIGYLLGKFAWRYAKCFCLFWKQIKCLFVSKKKRKELLEIKDTIARILMSKE